MKEIKPFMPRPEITARAGVLCHEQNIDEKTDGTENQKEKALLQTGRRGSATIFISKRITTEEILQVCYGE